LIRGAKIAAAIGAVALLAASQAGAQPAQDADQHPTKDTAAPDVRPREVSAYGPRNAVSLHPWSLLGPGVLLQYERYAFPRWVSVATALGFRTSGQEDFGSLALSTALEGRLWLIGRAPFTKHGERAMVGPYVAARVDLTWTRMWSERDDRTIGTTIEHEESVLFGYRVALGPVEVTPALGFGASTQHDTSGRLASLTRPALKMGMTLGVMF